MIVGCHMVGEKFNPFDKLSKKQTHQKIWDHIKQLLFYSGNPCYLIKPGKELVEKAKITASCNNFNISPTTYLF
jgi:hypothetical protein